VTDERDELLGRVVHELRTLPAVAEDDVARIVARARATPQDAPDDVEGDDALGTTSERPRPEGDGYSVTVGRARRPRLSIGAAAAMALAAGLVGFLVRGAPERTSAGTTAVAVAPDHRIDGGTTAPTLPGIAPAAATAAEEAPRPTQFVLEAPGAERVTVVGDFNGWDPQATPLVRDGATGLWTATLPLVPGRHVYSFLVDGRRTLDPRAPRAHDAALGATTSVVIVGLTGGM
jgi:hypothetical protein